MASFQVFIEYIHIFDNVFALYQCNSHLHQNYIQEHYFHHHNFHHQSNMILGSLFCFQFLFCKHQNLQNLNDLDPCRCNHDNADVLCLYNNPHHQNHILDCCFHHHNFHHPLALN
eukprot:05053.XXX_150142_150486_1 [CDS] Oithona nana genome sequencing.